jgi:Protein of unknown function (DUF664)
MSSGSSSDISRNVSLAESGCIDVTVAQPGPRTRQDLATYQREIELARSAVHGRALDEAVHGRTRDTDISLRWIFLHMIGEYARHNGHADLIRERLDGATGQ